MYSLGNARPGKDIAHRADGVASGMGSRKQSFSWENKDGDADTNSTRPFVKYVRPVAANKESTSAGGCTRLFVCVYQLYSSMDGVHGTISITIVCIMQIRVIRVQKENLKIKNTIYNPHYKSNAHNGN